MGVKKRPISDSTIFLTKKKNFSVCHLPFFLRALRESIHLADRISEEGDMQGGLFTRKGNKGRRKMPNAEYRIIDVVKERRRGSVSREITIL